MDHNEWRGTVLVVDDNEDNVDLAEQILEDDYDIITADSGQACIDMAAAEQPDVIVLDVQMPGMDGYEALEKMQTMDACKNIPVIFLSARYRDVDRVVHGLELGALDYITKPVDDELLQAKVRVAVRIKRAEDLVRQQRAELSVANRDLKSFSYSASHDLRAPLRHIKSYSEALLEDYAKILPQEGRFMLERIATSVQHMDLLIEGLLNFSRCTVTELNKVEVDLSLIAEHEWVKLRQGEPERQIEIDIAPGLSAVGDKSALSVVLYNLLDNAWKYSKNTVQPSIAFGVMTEKKLPVYFVKDNGAGFNMANADKLYEPFSRLHNQDEFEGNGIGLATVHRIVQKHGGEIWAESIADEGATFFFTLGGG